MESYIREITSKGGKARAESLTPSARRKIARAGGTAAWTSVSAEERSRRMRELIKKRWAKAKRRTT